MSRYIAKGISFFVCSSLIGFGLIGFIENTIDAVLLGVLLIIAMLSVIFTLLLKINDSINKKSVR